MTWIILILIFILIVLFRIKSKAGKGKLLINNPNTKKYKDEINKVLKNNSSIINSSVILIILLIVIYGGIVFLIICLFGRTSLSKSVAFLLFVILILLIGKVYSKYKIFFKEKIVKKVIEEYNNDLIYSPNMGFPINEYLSCNFKEIMDKYYSEDLVVSKDKTFRFADIETRKFHIDSNGEKSERITYSGSIASMSIKYINLKLFLDSNRLVNNKYLKIDLENEEFNKLFSIYTDNELLAYKLLTPDVMEKFVELAKNSFKNLDIRIINNMIYIRFNSGDGFTPSVLNKWRERDSICESLVVLDKIKSDLESIKAIIESKNI